MEPPPIECCEDNKRTTTYTAKTCATDEEQPEVNGPQAISIILLVADSSPLHA